MFYRHFKVRTWLALERCLISSSSLSVSSTIWHRAVPDILAGGDALQYMKTEWVRT